MTATLKSWKVFIIEPEYAVNLLTDPSFETGITNYSGVGTIEQSAEQARRGKYSAKVTPGAASSDSYIYTTYVSTPGLDYSFSADVYMTAGYSYTIKAVEGDGTIIGSTSCVGNGYWQRKSVSFNSTTGSINLVIDRPADQGSAAAWYTDGWLLKTGDDNAYFDGDTVDTQLDLKFYGWSGVPHASQSWRSASTRSGGTLLDISDYGKIIGIAGLGLTGFVTNVSGLALGGELYQNTHANARPFSIVLQQDDTATIPGVTQRNLARLQKAVNPKRMSIDQPLRLVFQGYDENGLEASDRVMIDCVYEGGLEGSLGTDWKAPRFTMNFKQFDPAIKADGYVVTSLSASGVTVSGASLGSVLIVDEDTGAGTAVTGFNNVVMGFVFDGSAGEYIYGLFTDYAGSADLDGIVYRNSAGVISALGSGVQGGVNFAQPGIDGKLYVASSATGIGGAAGADYVAYWDTSWHAMAAGLNDQVISLCCDNSGNIYAGGIFTVAVTGTLTVNRIAKWNGSAWSAIGGSTKGVNAKVTTLAALHDSRIILGGDFTAAGGDAGIQYLAIYDPDTDAFSSLGAAPDAGVVKVLYDRINGLLYVFGAFTTIGGITANHAAYWDGNNWTAMPGVEGATLGYGYLANGYVYGYGEFGDSGGANALRYWNGSKWMPLEYETIDVVYSVGYKPATNETFVSAFYATSAVDVAYTIPAVSTITNSTEGYIYPWVVFDNCGSYVYSLWNRTTGDRIYLNGLTVGAGEKIRLSFAPTGYTIESTIRGDMRSAVGAGSSATFKLAPGANYVSVFVYPSPVTDATIPLYYYPAAYISLDETVYE